MKINMQLHMIVFLGFPPYDHHYVLGPDCNHGELRLHGDRGPNEGRVEICFEGVWSIVCGYEWDYNDALVVCRELGLPTTGSYNKHTSLVFMMGPDKLAAGNTHDFLSSLYPLSTT